MHSHGTNRPSSCLTADAERSNLIVLYLLLSLLFKWHFSNTNGTYTFPLFSSAVLNVVEPLPVQVVICSLFRSSVPCVLVLVCLGPGGVWAAMYPECQARTRTAPCVLVPPPSVWPQVSEAPSYNTPRWTGWLPSFPSTRRCSEYKNPKSNEWDL